MPSPRLAAVAAVVLPASLLACTAMALLRADASAPVSDRTRDMDAQLASFPPDIVIVGNSKAGSDIDGAALAAALDEPTRIATLLVYGSGSPAWYALLEQRVFDAGYAPRLVIVYGQLGSMLHGSDVADSERRAIEAVVTQASDVLDRRVLRRDALGRARDRASALHDAAVDGIRNAGLRQFFPDTSLDDARASLERLFSAAATRSATEARVLPIAEARPEAMQAADEDPAAGFLPEIVRISHAHGARVLFVRAPVGGTARAKDSVDAAVEDRLYALINAMGVSWIDLHELALTTGAFRDDLHMTPIGARLLTEALAERMAAGDVLAGGVLRAEPPMRALAIQRLGAIPGVTVGRGKPAAGEPCSWTFPVDGPDALADDRLFAAGLGMASPVRVVADGIELAPHASRAGDKASCSGSFSHIHGELRVSTSATAATPVVAHLDPATDIDAGAGRRVTWLYPETELQWTLPAATNGTHVGVEATLRPVAGEPTATLRVGDREVPFTRRGRLLHASLELPAQSAPWPVGIRAGRGAWLVVHQLRVNTPDPHWLVGEDWAHTYLLASTPRFEPRPDGDAFPASIATLSPVDVEAHTGVRCAPRPAEPLHRACHRGHAFLPGWLLEGDVATIHYTAARMAAHPLGIDTLTLEAAAFGAQGQGEAALDVEIVRLHGSQATSVWKGSATFPTDGAPAKRILTIDRPLGPASPHEVILRVGGASLLVTAATLSERESDPAAAPPPP